MNITTHSVAGRTFINFGDGSVVIPADRIKRFDFNVANGGASDRSVRIVTDDPDEEIIFAFENRDAIYEWLTGQAVPQ